MRDPIPVYVHLRRAKDLMDRDYARELDLPAPAREAHASSAHFVRSFKEAAGISRDELWFSRIALVSKR